MDLVKKMIEATEQLVVDQINFTKLDVSIGDVDNPRVNYDQGFMVKPTTLEQQGGGVGFVFFMQGFDISLYQKLRHRGSARAQLFDIYAKLESLLDKLYTVRVVGDNYQVVEILEVGADEPRYSDNFLSITLSFKAYYRRKNVF